MNTIDPRKPINPRNPPEHIYRVPAYYRHRFGRMVPRVRIGATYSPAIRITPAFHTPPRDERGKPSALKQWAWGAGLTFGFVAFIGLTHLLA